MTKEARSPNDEWVAEELIAPSQVSARPLSDFGLRHSFVIRHSSFELCRSAQGFIAVLFFAGWTVLGADRPPASTNSAPPPRPAAASLTATSKVDFAILPTNLPAPKAAPAKRSTLNYAFTKTAPSSLIDLKAIEQHVKTLVARVSPTVVAVEIAQGSGSGVIISEDGLVLTAGHVVGRPNRDVKFTFPDGKTARGKTLGAVAGSDTGLVKITDRGPWPHADVGDLKEARLGDWTLALGHPGGFDRQRSLVVRLGRIIRIAPDALQTDCTISPGDSGGPVFDMHGRVIGIHSFISESATDNFHVPITKFTETWERLLKGETTEDLTTSSRAYAGATGVDDPGGCRLEKVETNSPAAKAGLKVGDVVFKVNGRDIKVASAFRRWVAEADPGETLELEIKRGDKTLALKMKVEAPPRRR